MIQHTLTDRAILSSICPIDQQRMDCICSHTKAAPSTCTMLASDAGTDNTVAAAAQWVAHSVSGPQQSARSSTKHCAPSALLSADGHLAAAGLPRFLPPVYPLCDPIYPLSTILSTSCVPCVYPLSNPYLPPGYALSTILSTSCVPCVSSQSIPGPPPGCPLSMLYLPLYFPCSPCLPLVYPLSTLSPAHPSFLPAPFHPSLHSHST